MLLVNSMFLRLFVLFLFSIIIHATACPYFASRSLAQEAEVVFAPYNYICDPQIREAMGINLKDNVIVLDEAHNIEDTAREAGSFELSNDKLESNKDGKIFLFLNF